MPKTTDELSPQDKALRKDIKDNSKQTGGIPVKNTIISNSETYVDENAEQYVWEINKAINRGKSYYKWLADLYPEAFGNLILGQKGAQLYRVFAFDVYTRITNREMIRMQKKNKHPCVKINIMDTIKKFWPHPSDYPNNLIEIVHELMEFFNSRCYELYQGRRWPFILISGVPETMDDLRENPYIYATVSIKDKLSFGGPAVSREILQLYDNNEYILTFITNFCIVWNKEISLNKVMKNNRKKMNIPSFVMEHMRGLSRNGLINLTSVLDQSNLTPNQKSSLFRKTILPMLDKLVKEGIIFKHYNEENKRYYITPQLWFFKSLDDITKANQTPVSYTHLTLPTKRIV